MLTIYFVRHGQTALSRENMFCGSLNPELTPEGRQMAHALADYYARVKWRAIYSSPMKRTIATAAPIAKRVRLKIGTEKGLREIAYGKWEGRTIEEAHKRWTEDHIKWLADPGWNAPTGGETANQVATRALAVIDKIRKRYRDGNVMVISHKATIRIILCSLLGIDIGRFRFRLNASVSSVSIVEFGAHGPLLKVLGDTTHLPENLRKLPGT